MLLRTLGLSISATGRRNQDSNESPLHESNDVSLRTHPVLLDEDQKHGAVRRKCSRGSKSCLITMVSRDGPRPKVGDLILLKWARRLAYGVPYSLCLYDAKRNPKRTAGILALASSWSSPKRNCVVGLLGMRR